jgi:transcriptional regulator with XRE-family HTH domain
MTLQQAGDGVGITYQQIRKYESGENRLSASMLYRLSRLFGVDPAFFFEGLGKPVVEDAPGEKEPAMLDALARIEDAEIRTHLERLIATLEKRK